MFGSLDVSSSGLAAQRTRMDVIASNVANQNTIYNEQGDYEPYRRRIAMLAPGDPGSRTGQGVHVREITLDDSEFRRVHDPSHPHADDAGYVAFPNVNPAMERVNALEASRAYEANIAAAEATKMMIQSSLRLLA